MMLISTAKPKKIREHEVFDTDNIAAVQRQLGQKNVANSMQYARISERELADVIEDR